MKLKYKNKAHEKAFRILMEEAEMGLEDGARLTETERRQMAFLYLLAMYQEDYKAYEGEPFYVEAYDEISLGGPTYLFEENIGSMERPHEAILKYAKALLKGESIYEEGARDEEWIQEAQKLLIG